MESIKKIIPSDFTKAIEIAKKEYGTEFYIDGGCAVMAALLADVAKNKNEFGEFLILIRVTDGDSYVSHVCFHHNETKDTYDISGGDDAEERWTTKIINECREMREEDPAFETESISFDKTSDIYEVLKVISSDYFLSIGSKWVEENYKSLRDKVLYNIDLLPNIENDEHKYSSYLNP